MLVKNRRVTRVPMLVVHTLSMCSARGTLTMGNLRLPCALGRSGIRAIKREGDGATPRGSFGLLSLRFRADRGGRPRTRLPTSRIAADDGWCDTPDDRNYNRPISLPYATGAERLWRTDRVYDLVVVMDHNIRPRTRFGGSAIFMHVARDGYRPTEGCIALSNTHLRLLLAGLRKGSRVRVGSGQHRKC